VDKTLFHIRRRVALGGHRQILTACCAAAANAGRLSVLLC
jgi:hypothetical protein